MNEADEFILLKARVIQRYEEGTRAVQVINGYGDTLMMASDEHVIPLHRLNGEKKPDHTKTRRL